MTRASGSGFTPLSEEQIQDIVDLYTSSPTRSINEVRLALGCTHKTVAKYLTERGVVLHPPRTRLRREIPLGKVCRVCGMYKDNELLYKDGVIYRGICKECRNEQRRDLYAHVDGETTKERVKDNRKKKPIPHRKYDLKKKFGLTWATYCDLFHSQGNACAGCRLPGDINDTGIWHVDHDHDCCSNPNRRTCGACIRGILCKWCNLTLGYAKDDSNRLRELADYLDSYNLVNGTL